jgi:protein SCO1/2
MNRWLVPLIGLVGMIFAVSVGALLFLAIRRQGAASGSPPLVPDPIVQGLRIPDFTLTDQDGRAVTQELLEGRITILDFIFTDCPFVCPGMTLEMTRLHERLADTPVRFLSISVNPRRDTPDRLLAYARRNNADTSRWSFLTGDYSVVEGIVTSIGFDLREDRSRRVMLDDGSTMPNITHPSKLLLVGPDRQVLGWYEFAWEEETRRLAARARAAAAELGRGR